MCIRDSFQGQRNPRVLLCRSGAGQVEVSTAEHSTHVVTPAEADRDVARARWEESGAGLPHSPADNFDTAAASG